MGIFDVRPTQDDVNRKADDIERKQRELEQEKQRLADELRMREQQNAQHRREIEEKKRKAGINTTGFFS